jgi:hypothetical protein
MVFRRLLCPGFCGPRIVPPRWCFIGILLPLLIMSICASKRVAQGLELLALRVGPNVRWL